MMEESQWDRIQRRAYEIWESEERPHGEDIRHWMQARQELEGDKGADAADDAGDAAVLNNASGENGILAASGDEASIIQGTRPTDIVATPDVEITTGAKPARSKIKKTEGP